MFHLRLASQAYINDLDEAVAVGARTKLVDIKLEAQSLLVMPTRLAGGGASRETSCDPSAGEGLD